MEPQAVGAALDLTAIVIAAIGGVFALIRGVAVYYVDKRVQDQQLRAVLENAVKNGLGIVQQAASGAAVKAVPPLDVPPSLAPGVQYVLDHAGEAVARFGITPEAIAEKLLARTGLAAIDTNLAATTSSATPAVVPPLAPSAPAVVPPGTDAQSLNRQELQSVLAQPAGAQ